MEHLRGRETNAVLSSPARPGFGRTLNRGFLSLAIALMAVAAGAFADPQPTAYSGRATGVVVSTSLTTLRFADTGELPPEGGAIDATVVSVEDDLVSADILLAVTMGFDGKAQSEAAVASVRLLPGTTNEVTAEFVSAKSIATCAGVSGSSEIVELNVGGQDVAVSGSPNQMVTVPGVFTLVINEQQDTSSGNTNAITVNALHLTLLAAPTEVIVSHAHSDITCGEHQPMPKDFVTGGGFILVDGGKANFGVSAGFKPGKGVLSGHLNYIDRVNGLHVKDLSIDNYEGSGLTRTFSGDATVNGQSGYTYKVTVTDSGEPGKDNDDFRIELSNGYSAAGKLAGGNIQLHV